MAGRRYDPLTKEQQELVTTLEIVRIAGLIYSSRGFPDCTTIAYSVQKTTYQESLLP